MNKTRVVGKLLFAKGRCMGKASCESAAEWEIAVSVSGSRRRPHSRHRLLCQACLVRYAALRVLRVDNVGLMLQVASALCG